MAALLLLLAACGGSAAPVTTAPATALVTGTVVAAPCRPVERPGDPPCPPVAGVLVDFGGATATTDAGGAYRLALPPGRYAIKVRAGGWERRANPPTATVGPGTTVLNLTYDSGIR